LEVILKNLTKTIKIFEILASRKTQFTRANPDPKLAPIVDNPNLISRKSNKEESLVSQIPLVKANSCPNEWLFLEELPFDVPFEQSLFRTKSKNALSETVLDLDFIADLEVQ